MKRLVYPILMILSVSLLLIACSGGGDGVNTPATTNKTASVSIGMDFGRTAQAFLGTVSDVNSVTVDVLNGATTVIVGEALSYDGSKWTGTINNLPVGPSLTFKGHAYNVSSTEIFNGTASQVLTGTSDSVDIIMNPIDDGVPASLPKITQITRPAEVTVTNTVSIDIAVEATSGETLSYDITAATSGGTFLNTTGTITLSGTTGTISVNYTAPGSVGTYIHTIKVTNSQGNYVETNFDTNVVYVLTSSAVNALFAPVVTALGAKRSGTDLTWTATVVDDGPAGELVYNWGFDGGLSFLDSTTNPAILQGYDQSVTGNLTCSVTDNNGAGGTTTISYALTAGMFPDTVVANTTGATDIYLSALSIMADASLISLAKTNAVIDVDAIVADAGYSATKTGNFAVYEKPLNSYAYGGNCDSDDMADDTFPSGVTIRFAIASTGEIIVGAIGSDNGVLSTLVSGGWGVYDLSNDSSLVDNWLVSFDMRANRLAYSGYQEYIDKILPGGHVTGGPINNDEYWTTAQFELYNAFSKPVHQVMTSIWHQQADYSWYNTSATARDQLLRSKWSPATALDAALSLKRFASFSYAGVTASAVGTTANGDNQNNEEVFLDNVSVGYQSNCGSIIRLFLGSAPVNVELNVNSNWSSSYASYRGVFLGDGITTINYSESSNNITNPSSSFDQNPAPVILTIPTGWNAN